MIIKRYVWVICQEQLCKRYRSVNLRNISVSLLVLRDNENASWSYPDIAVIQSIYFLAYYLPESGAWCYSRLKDTYYNTGKREID